jgi:hypothetical protein
MLTTKLLDQSDNPITWESISSKAVNDVIDMPVTYTNQSTGRQNKGKIISVGKSSMKIRALSGVVVQANYS